MIYTDGIHIISDTSVKELHQFCEELGIKRCWFHSGSKFPHYDIPKLRRKNFFTDHPEIKYTHSKTLVKILKQKELPS